MKQSIEKIGSIEWGIMNNDWEGTAVSGGLVANKQANIRLLAAQLKKFMGLNLKDSELEYFSPNRDFPTKRLSAKRA
ncbi:MAG: hypothetical protein ABFD08_06970 [Syntrophomonas sp.]